MYSLKDFGSFYLSGREIELEFDNSQTYGRKAAEKTAQHYQIEQAYVQFYIPQTIKQDIPIILSHGGGHTGAIWETTPDGRAGWLQLCLQQGFKTYVIDNVERGRSGWCSLPGVWEDAIELRSAEETWQLFRMGLSEDFKERKPFANQQFPMESFDKLVCYNVPRWRSHNRLFTDALKKLLKKLGRAHLITHSQSGHFGINCLMEAHDHIESLVLLEAATFPEPIEIKNSINTNVIFLYGDNLQHDTFWRQTHQKGLEVNALLRDHRIESQVIELPNLNILGNSHMMMMDKNNETVFDVLMQALNL
jgi:pimeloyl-ACP methyl ester carboxylesterase